MTLHDMSDLTSEQETRVEADLPIANGPTSIRAAEVLELAEEITGHSVDTDRLDRLLAARASGQIAVEELYAMMALMAQQHYERLETRVARLEENLGAIEEQSQSVREASLARRLQEAEEKAEARLRVIEEQQRALDAYRFWDWRARFRRAIRPQLGVLYQYDPRPLRIPGRYLNVTVPAAPPSISIVTPSFRSGVFLERTLTSVLDQEYPQLEMVVQDGGSTDETPEILETYAPKLAAAVMEPDEGQADALNRGFARTSGEIMAYLNADDMLLPGCLAYIAAYFRDHPEVDVVYGHRVVVDEFDAEIGRWVMPPHDDAVLKWVDYLPQETMFWRRSIWDRAGGRIDNSMKFAMDWELILRFQDAQAKFVRLPRFLGAFRVHPHQKTSAELENVGLVEMDRLRTKLHARHITPVEAYQMARGYLLRHRLCHWGWRLGLLRY
jgi:glycosyltransferase involved in cell wall biosynthesis